MIMSGFWRKEKGSSVSRHEMTIRMPSIKTFSSLSAGWSDVAQLQYWIAYCLCSRANTQAFL